MHPQKGQAPFSVPKARGIIPLIVVRCDVSPNTLQVLSFWSPAICVMAFLREDADLGLEVIFSRYRLVVISPDGEGLWVKR